MQLLEDGKAYTATIHVGGSSPSSGLSAVPTVHVPAAGEVTHEVEFGVVQPAGLGRLKLRLLHPVDSSTASE